MEKSKKQQMREGAATAAGGFTGAVAGVVAGTVVMPEEAAAQEVAVNDAPVAGEGESRPTPAAQQQTTHTQNPAKPTVDPAVKPEPESISEPADNPDNSVTPATQEDVHVEVVGYHTIDNADGTQSDVAVLNVEEQPMAIIDVDQDGAGDLLFADFNQNSQIDEDEIIDITEADVPMQPLAEAAGADRPVVNHDGALASNGEQFPDYVNDANVDEFMV